MGIRESLLNTITSVGNGDFIRIVTSAGASSKATLANVFKSFESGLGAKSSLTNSDYVRVVGTDNNSYKQTLGNVANTYEQNLGQKSSLTVNDYIRVVGSDNASYKQLVSDVAKKIIENYTGSSLAGSSQSVKSALDALNSKIRDSLIRQYRTGEKSKINIAANGVSSVDGILTRYDGANLSVYAFHAYTPNGSSFSEAVGVDVKTGQAWSELSTSGENLVLAVGQYKAGLLTLSYTSGHEPTIAYV